MLKIMHDRMINEDVAIRISNVKKKYKLGTINNGTLRADLSSWWARVRHKEDPNKVIGSKIITKTEDFYALKGVSFDVKRGEALGIVGRNGAGKSTLLKIISRITAPTEGDIWINGRISSMLEVGTGFHRELTGRENIYLNGSILGMSKKEIEKKIDQIIDFSELREFIDTPVKRYSSGMYVKLGFAVASHMIADILIIDEILSVGDARFRKKCLEKINEKIHDEKTTILFVSHMMNVVEQLCDRLIVLDHGTVIHDGDVKEGLEVYLQDKQENTSKPPLKLTDIDDNGNLKRLAFRNVELPDRKEPTYNIGEKITLRILVHSFKDLSNVGFRFTVKTTETKPITMIYSQKLFTFTEDEDAYLNFELDTKGLAPAEYVLTAIAYSLDNPEKDVSLDVISKALIFKIEGVIERMDLAWNHKNWGYFYGNSFIAQKEEVK